MRSPFSVQFERIMLLKYASPDSSRYCTLHCSGYMRSWPRSDLDSETDGEKVTTGLTCLVTMCRVQAHASHQPPKDVKVKPTKFVTRCAIDGKFTFVEQQWVFPLFSSHIPTDFTHLAFYVFMSSDHYSESWPTNGKFTQANYLFLIFIVDFFFFTEQRLSLVISRKKFWARLVTSTSTRMTCSTLQKNTGKVIDHGGLH